MAKKKSNAKVSVLSIVIKSTVLLLGIVALCMAFLPFVTRNDYLVEKIVSTYSLSGFVMGFGASGTFSSQSANIPDWTYFVKDFSSSSLSAKGITVSLAANVGVLITLILAIVGIALALLSLFVNKKSGRKVVGIFLLLGGLCFIAAGIMAFFPVQFGSYQSNLTEGYRTGTEYTLGIGALLFAIFSLVSGLISTVYGLFNAAK